MRAQLHGHDLRGQQPPSERRQLVRSRVGTRCKAPRSEEMSVVQAAGCPNALCPDAGTLPARGCCALLGKVGAYLPLHFQGLDIGLVLGECTSRHRLMLCRRGKGQFWTDHKFPCLTWESCSAPGFPLAVSSKTRGTALFPE